MVMSKKKKKAKKVWVIYDARAWENTDRAVVYEAFYEGHGDTLEGVKKTRDEDWPDGVVYEYTEKILAGKNNRIVENETLIG